jgi:hypothetical protein
MAHLMAWPEGREGALQSSTGFIINKNCNSILQQFLQHRGSHG